MALDFDDKCFVCFKTGGNLNIFTTYNIGHEKEELYVEVIRNCFNIEIAQDSGLNAMCNDCSIQLRRAYTFKNDMLQAINRLVVSQVVDSAVEKDYTPIEYLDNQFESDYNINAILNHETGQISYTLDKVDENKDPSNEPDTYLIDLDNDAIMTKKEAENNKKATKRKRNEIVKENIPNIGNNEIKKPIKARVKKQATDKEKKGVVEALPDAENKDKRKPENSKKIITIDGDLVSAPAEQEIDRKPKRGRPKKEVKEPPFTLEPGQTKCTLCSAQFETNRALSTHMNKHFPEYVCNECGIVFASQSRLRAHGHQAHVQGPITCKHCGKNFTNANARNTHMWRVHTQTDPFKCAQCGERFKTYLKRLRHVQSAHGSTVEYPCQYCDKKFAYAASRTKHVGAVHFQSRSHKCPSCPSSFARRRGLAAHRASKHGDGEKKYQCDVCQTKFFFKSALKWHVNQHNKHKCTQCDTIFPNAKELEAHLKIHEPTHDIRDALPMLDPVLQFEDLADYARDWVLAP